MKSLTRNTHGGLTDGPSPPRWVIPLAAVVGLLAYLSTLVTGVQDWATSPDEQHGFLVVPIAFALLYLRRDEFPHGASRIDLRGLVLIAVAAGMRIYGDQYIRPWMHMWSLPLWIGGTVWLFGGWRVFRWAAPAIAFLVFMAPLPGQVQTAAGFPLQRIAATGGGGILQMLGQPAFVSGTTILLGENVLDVERACSGLRMFQGMLAVAVAWSLFCRYRWPRFLLMFAIAPMIAILVNVIRIAFTGLLFQYVSSDAGRAFSHDWAGLLMIPAGIVIFFLIDSITDRLQRWNGAQGDRWLMTGAAASVLVLVIGGTSYAVHKSQQHRAVVFVLDQARELADGDEEERQRAVNLYRRYLTVYDEDAEVMSELATLWVKSGRQQWPRAARLYEMAFRYDSSRQPDAIASLMLLASTGDWQRLWDQSDRIVDRLDGDLRRVAMRLRTQAVGQLVERSGITGDLDRMFAACREGIREDDEYFRHAWQLALLTQSHPNRARRSDLVSASEPSDDDGSGTWTPDSDLPLATPIAMAVAIVDRSIERHPGHAQPWLYRANLLEFGIRELGGRGDDTRLREELADAVNRAVEIANERFPLDQPVPPMPQRQVAETSPEAVRQGDAVELDGEQPIVDGRWRRERAERATAAKASMLSGSLALRDGETERAREALSRSVELDPRNADAYARLAQTYPIDAYDRRIELYERGLKNCGSAEVALLFPLVETYVAAGRETDAEKLLEPLDEMLPNLRGVSRGRLTLMRNAARAGGLSRQGRIREAAEMLQSTLDDPVVRSNRNGFADFYARVQFQLGSLYRAMSRTAAAIAAFEEGGRFDSSSPQWMLETARLYETIGDLPAALERYQQAAAVIGNRQPSVYLSIARVLLAQQRQMSADERNLEEVRTMLRVATSRGAAATQAATISAETYIVEGNFDAAVQVVERQLEQSPDEPTLAFTNAMIRQLAGDTDAALEQIPRYREAGASASEAALLKVMLLARAGRIGEAEAALEGIGDDVDESQRRSVQIQVILAKLRSGETEQGVAELEQLAASHPDELAVQRFAADVFADMGSTAAVEQAEKNLRAIEGERGTAWRIVRANRLLRSDPGPEELEEVERVVDRLTELLPNGGQTRYLRGRLAERAGRWDEALSAYEEAWSTGIRDAGLASRLLAALNRTGQTRRAGDYIAQLQDLVPQSTSLFDIAMPQYVRGERSRDAFEIAERWAEEDPTPENLVRLGHTLMTIAGSGRTGDVFASDDPVGQAVDQAEQAFTSAIRDDPENIDAWVGAFQVQAGLRRDREKAVENLKAFSKQLEIPPLRRSFVLSQLYTAIGEDARAGIEFERTLELVEDREPELRQAIRMVAARFFAQRRPERAIELCREELREFPDSESARTYLVGLLGDRNRIADLNESIEIQGGLMTDPTPARKRLRAQLLAKRAELTEAREPGLAEAREPGLAEAREPGLAEAREPEKRPVAGEDAAVAMTSVSSSEFVAPDQSPARDRAEAIELLRSITPREAADALNIAVILAADGQTAEAFNAFREALRLESPGADRLATVTEFWNRNYAASGEYAPIADRYLRELRDAEGGAVAWLRLSLRRAAIEVAATAEHSGGESPESPDPPESNDAEATLVRREAEIFDQYRDSFIPAESEGRFVNALVGMISGIAAAERPERIPAAIEQLARSDDDAPAVASALSLALIRWGNNDPVAEVLVSEILRRVAPDAEPMAEQVMMAGDAFYLAGRLQLAAEYLRGAAELLPKAPQAANNLAIVLAELGEEPDEAFRFAERAIELDPGNADKLDTKLVVAMLLEKWETAEEVAESLDDEAEPTVLMHLAYLAQKRDRVDEAHALFRQARDGNVANRISAPYDRMIYTALRGDGET